MFGKKQRYIDKLEGDRYVLQQGAKLDQERIHKLEDDVEAMTVLQKEQEAAIEPLERYVAATAPLVEAAVSTLPAILKLRERMP